MLLNGFLHTGTRLISWNDTRTIDLWKTDANVEITLDEGKRIVLDEDESQVLRKWAELSMQTAVLDAQYDLVRKRCELQDMVVVAANLNRKSARAARTPGKKKPAKVAKIAQASANVVDIDAWKASRRSEASAIEVPLNPAA
jgi:hypothetical protein